MKFKKTLMASTLVSAMFLAACGGGTNNPEPAVGTNTQEPVLDPGVQEPVSDGVMFPDRLDLTIHYKLDYLVFDSNWPAWQQALELSGTNINLINVANEISGDGTASEQFTLQAADRFPAHIYGGQQLATRFMEFGMQEAFVPLNDLIEEHAPNFRRILEENPGIRNFLTAPDGNIYHLPTIPDGLTSGGRAFFIRQDWLDLLEMEQPQTIEELEAVLVAFRDEIPPLIGVDRVFPYIDGNWYNLMRLANFWGARGYGHDAHAVRVAPKEDEDVLFHTWLAPEMMIGMQNISRWYQEGLIDQQVITRGNAARQELLSQNLGGMTYDFPLSTADFNNRLRDTIEGFNFLPMAPPANIHGVRISEHERLPVQPHGWAISHTNPDPVRTIIFMDFFYSDHGRNLLSFGAEGISFEYDEEGNPRFLDFVHEQGIPVTDVLRLQMGALQFMGYKQNFQYEIELATPEAKEAMRINSTDEFSIRQLPVLNFTDEELRVITEIQPQLNAYLDEHFQSFILNDWNLIEEQWDSFVAGAIRMGADELVAAYQSAFNRYLMLLN